MPRPNRRKPKQEEPRNAEKLQAEVAKILALCGGFKGAPCGCLTSPRFHNSSRRRHVPSACLEVTARRSCVFVRFPTCHRIRRTFVRKSRFFFSRFSFRSQIAPPTTETLPLRGPTTHSDVSDRRRAHHCESCSRPVRYA